MPPTKNSMPPRMAARTVWSRNAPVVCRTRRERSPRRCAALQSQPPPGRRLLERAHQKYIRNSGVSRRRGIRSNACRWSGQFAFRRVRRTELRAVDVPVAGAIGERNAPCPAVLHGHANGLARDGLAHRRRRRHGRIIEQVVRKADEGNLQGLLDQRVRESGAVHKQIRGNRLALASAHGPDRAVGAQRDIGHVAAFLANSTFERLLVRELSEQSGVEVMPMPDVEREVIARLGRAVSAFRIARARACAPRRARRWVVDRSHRA